MRLNRTSEWKVMTIWTSRELRVQFQMSRYIMGLYRTSEWKVMTIWISRELLLFNFERVDISWASIIHPSQKLWLSEYAESFRVQFRASRCIMCLNWTSEWKVLTNWISQELLLFNLECLDISWASIIHPSQKLCCLNLSWVSVVQFPVSRYIMGLNDTPMSKIMSFEFF